MKFKLGAFILASGCIAFHQYTVAVLFLILGVLLKMDDKLETQLK